MCFRNVTHRRVLSNVSTEGKIIVMPLRFMGSVLIDVVHGRLWIPNDVQPEGWIPATEWDLWVSSGTVSFPWSSEMPHKLPRSVSKI